jgi:hypothetical protein
MYPAALPVAPNTRRMVAFSPSCASEITSFTPRRPRLTFWAGSRLAGLGDGCGLETQRLVGLLDRLCDHFDIRQGDDVVRSSRAAA